MEGSHREGQISPGRAFVVLVRACGFALAPFPACPAGRPARRPPRPRQTLSPACRSFLDLLFSSTLSAGLLGASEATSGPCQQARPLLAGGSRGHGCPGRGCGSRGRRGPPVWCSWRRAAEQHARPAGGRSSAVRHPVSGTISGAPGAFSSRRIRRPRRHTGRPAPATQTAVIP